MEAALSWPLLRRLTEPGAMLRAARPHSVSVVRLGPHGARITMKVSPAAAAALARAGLIEARRRVPGRVCWWRACPGAWAAEAAARPVPRDMVEPCPDAPPVLWRASYDARALKQGGWAVEDGAGRRIGPPMKSEDAAARRAALLMSRASAWRTCECGMQYRPMREGQATCNGCQALH